MFFDGCTFPRCDVLNFVCMFTPLAGLIGSFIYFFVLLLSCPHTMSNPVHTTALLSAKRPQAAVRSLTVVFVPSPPLFHLFIDSSLGVCPPLSASVHVFCPSSGLYVVHPPVCSLCRVGTPSLLSASSSNTRGLPPPQYVSTFEAQKPHELTQLDSAL